jgi:hypothetical protein
LYFQSVAKCIFDYTLIDAAEKYYKDRKEEFIFDYANALCSVAASHIDGNVDESDDFIQNMTAEVCLGDLNTTGSVELEKRRSMIEGEITTLMLDAEEQELEGPIKSEVKMALKQGCPSYKEGVRHEEG